MKLAVIVLVMGLMCVGAWGETYYWIGGTSGNWYNGNNWSKAYNGSAVESVPGDMDTAYFTGDVPQTVKLTADVEVGNITTNTKGTSLVTINTNGNKLSVKDTFLLVQQNGGLTHFGNCKIEGNGSVECEVFDFGNASGNVFEIESGTTLTVKSDLFANGGDTTRMSFTGSGTLYLPKGGANVNYGESKIDYSGFSGTILPYIDGIPAYTFSYSATNFPTNPVTITLGRKTGSGTANITFKYTVSIIGSETYTFGGSDVSDGSYGTVIQSGDTTSFDLSCTSGSVATGNGIKITIRNPDDSMDLGSFAWYKDKPTWTGASDSDWMNSGNWTGVEGISDLSDFSGFDIEINSGVSNYPNIDEDIKVKSLSVTAGAQVTISSGSLTISSGKMLVTSTGRFIGTGGEVIFTTGNGAGGDFFKADYPDNSKFYDLSLTQGETYRASCKINVSGSLKLDNNTDFYPVSGNFTVGKDLTLEESATLTSVSGDLTVKGNTSCSHNITTESGKQFYEGDFTLTGDATLTASEVTFEGNISGNSKLTVNGKTVFAGSGKSLDVENVIYEDNITVSSDNFTFKKQFSGFDHDFSASSGTTAFEKNVDFSSLNSFDANNGTIQIYNTGSEITLKTLTNQIFNKINCGGNIKFDLNGNVVVGEFKVPNFNTFIAGNDWQINFEGSGNLTVNKSFDIDSANTVNSVSAKTGTINVKAVTTLNCDTTMFHVGSRLYVAADKTLKTKKLYCISSTKEPAVIFTIDGTLKSTELSLSSADATPCCAKLIVGSTGTIDAESILWNASTYTNNGDEKPLVNRGTINVSTKLDVLSAGTQNLVFENEGILNATGSATVFAKCISGNGIVNLDGGTSFSVTSENNESSQKKIVAAGSAVNAGKAGIVLAGDSFDLDNSIVFTGNNTITGLFTINGNWSDTGTLTSAGSTVVLGGSPSKVVVSDSYAFDELKVGAGKSAQFKAGTHISVKKATFDNSTVSSDTAGTEWFLDVSGATDANIASLVSARNVTAKDSIASIFLNATGTDSGNNFNWFDSVYIWKGGTAGNEKNWATASNWKITENQFASQSPSVDSTYTKVVIDTQIAGNDPEIPGNLSLKEIVVNSGNEFDLKGFDLSLSSTESDSFSNSGTVKLFGNQSLPVSSYIENKSGSSVEYYGGVSGGEITAKPFGNAFHNLSVNQYSILQIGDSDISVSGTFSNEGTIEVNGTGTFAPVTMDVDSGLVKYSGANTVIKDFGTTDYYDLEISAGTGTFDSADIKVANNFTLSGGTVSFIGKVSAESIEISSPCSLTADSSFESEEIAINNDITDISETFDLTLFPKTLSKKIYAGTDVASSYSLSGPEIGHLKVRNVKIGTTDCTDEIDINGDVLSLCNLYLTTGGSICNSSGTVGTSSGNLYLNAKSGIGTISTQAVNIGSLAGTVNAEKTDAVSPGDIHLNITTSGPVALGGTVNVLNANGDIKISSVGSIVIGGNVSCSLGDLTLQAGGTIENDPLISGILSTGSGKKLTLNSSLGIGSASSFISIASDQVASSCSTSGGIYILNSLNATYDGISTSTDDVVIKSRGFAFTGNVSTDGEGKITFAPDLATGTISINPSDFSKFISSKQIDFGDDPSNAINFASNAGSLLCDAVVNGTCTNEGTIDTNNKKLTFNENLTNNGTITGSSGLITFEKDYLGSGLFVASSGTTIFRQNIDFSQTTFNANNGTVIFAREAADDNHTLSVRSDKTTAFNNMEISKYLTCSGEFIINGNWTNNGTYTGTSSTLHFGGISEIDGTAETTFDNVVIDSSASVKAVSSQINVSGSWTNNSGSAAFDANLGKVIFTGVTIIGGTSGTTFYDVKLLDSAVLETASTFNDFTAVGLGGKSITLSEDQSINGILTLSGTDNDNKLFVADDDTGKGFKLADTQEDNGNYLSIGLNIKIKDSLGNADGVEGIYYKSSGSVPYGATPSNADWATVINNGWRIKDFGELEYTWNGGSAGNEEDWATRANWDINIVPGVLSGKTASVGATVRIPDGKIEYPVLTETLYSVKSLTIGSSTETTHDSLITLSGSKNLIVTELLSNYGRIKYTNSGRITDDLAKPINDSSKGCVEYAVTIPQDISDFTYYDIEITDGILTAPNPLVVNHTASISGGNSTFEKIVTILGTDGFVVSGAPVITIKEGLAVKKSAIEIPAAATLSLAGTIRSVSDDDSISKSQTYHCTVSLIGDTNFEAKSQKITFDDEVTGAFVLTAGSDASTEADVSFSGNVELKSLSVNGKTKINCETITSTSTQKYGDAVTLLKNSAITAKNGDVLSSVEFDGNVTGESLSLSVDADILMPNGNVITLENLEFLSPVQKLTATEKNLFFKTNLLGSANNVILTANNCQFNKSIGTSVNKFASLIIHGDSYIFVSDSEELNGTNTIFEGNVFVNSTGNWTVNSIVEVNENFALFNGSVKQNFDFICKKDILFLNGSSSAMNDDSVSLDGNSGISNLFAYHNSNRDGTKHAAVSLENFPVSLPDGTAISHDSYSSAFVPAAGITISALQNFYDNGVDLTSTDIWNLVLKDNDNQLNAFAELYNAKISNCSANYALAAAENCTDGGNNSNVFFSRPEFLENDETIPTFGDYSGTYTVYDDVVRVEFVDSIEYAKETPVKRQLKIENSNNEISRAVSSIKYDNGSKVFAGAFVDAEGTVSTDGKGDLSVFYLRANDTWKTDATGTSSGNAQSTDRNGNQSAIVPNIDLPKALSTLYESFRDEHKNRISHKTGTARFANVSDRCSPVLIHVYSGQELHQDTDTQTDYDAHNFIEFQYSEAVDITETLKASDGVVNLQSTETLGAIKNLSGSEKLEISGLARIQSGKVVSGIQGEISTWKPHSLYRNFSINAEASPEVQTHRIRLSVAGYVDGTVDGFKNWKGYVDEIETPSGNITRIANDLITDVSVNKNKYSPNSAENHPLLQLSLEASGTGSELYGKWDVSKPVFVPFAKNEEAFDAWYSTGRSTYYEAVGSVQSDAIPYLQNLEFHLYDNSPSESNYGNFWWKTKIGWTLDGSDSPTGLPDISGGSRELYNNPGDSLKKNWTTGGIRRSSLYEANKAFSYASDFNGISNFKTAGNGSSGLEVTIGQQVKSNIFRYDRDPLTKNDGLYISVPLDSSDLGHLPARTNFDIKFDSSKCYITDLAGNRIHYDDVIQMKSVDLIPPAFTMSLSPIGHNKVYVVFTKQLAYDMEYVSKLSTSKFAEFGENLCSALVVVQTGTDTPSQTHSIKDVEFVSGTEEYTALLFTLEDDVTLNEVETLSIKAVGTDEIITNNAGLKMRKTYICDDIENYLEVGKAHVISDFALNVADVLYAYADVGETGWNDKDIYGIDSAPHSSDYAVHEFDAMAGNYGKIRSGGDITLQVDFKNGADRELELVVDRKSTVNKNSISQTFNKLTGSDWRVWLNRLPSENFNSFASLSTEINDTKLTGPVSQNVDGSDTLKNFTFKNDVFNFKGGEEYQFIFRIKKNDGSYVMIDHDNDETTDKIPLHALWMPESRIAAGDFSFVDLWSFTISDITSQRGGVTILNNVIDVNVREQSVIQVDLKQSGNLNVYIMTLDGNIVRRLSKGRTEAGTHYFKWDGTNLNGNPVARGLYFVRVAGPGIDETRKIMCVKK